MSRSAEKLGQNVFRITLGDLERPFSMTAKAKKDTEAGFIPRERLHRFLRANPDICFQVLTILAEEIRSTRIRR